MADISPTSSIINTNTNVNKNRNDDKKLSEKLKEAQEGYTARGTRIVKPGQELDKNAFLKILSAELSNQDPLNAKDGTEFVTQMAQFSGLEQMANLNNTMRFTGAVSFIDKYVMLNKTDLYGELYHGMVTGISKDGDVVKLNVFVGEEKDKNGNTVPIMKQFKVEDILEIINMPQKEGKSIEDKKLEAVKAEKTKEDENTNKLENKPIDNKDDKESKAV